MAFWRWHFAQEKERQAAEQRGLMEERIRQEIPFAVHRHAGTSVRVSRFECSSSADSDESGSYICISWFVFRGLAESCGQ